MEISPFFNLIRWKNLLILASTLLIIKFGFIDIFTTESSLNTFQFIIFLISTIFIAAAGYIINDILDIETDTINKPTKCIINKSIPIKTAYTVYFTLNIMGVLFGFYIANYFNLPVLALIPILTSYLLYIYSTTLKKLPLIGNILIAFLVCLSILTLAFLDLILTKNTTILGYHYTLFQVLFDFAIFAFLLNFIREIAKDMEDIEGDKHLNMKTLPIYLGIKSSKLVVAISTILLLVGLVYFLITYLVYTRFIFYYFIIFIIAPLLFTLYKLYGASSKASFKLISLTLKICMIFGILAIILISLTIKNVL